jgi:hypothetical protein
VCGTGASFMVEPLDVFLFRDPALTGLYRDTALKRGPFKKPAIGVRDVCVISNFSLCQGVNRQLITS